MSSPGISLRFLKNIIHYFVSGIAFFISLLGIFLLGFWLWQAGSSLDWKLFIFGNISIYIFDLLDKRVGRHVCGLWPERRRKTKP